MPRHNRKRRHLHTTVYGAGMDPYVVSKTRSMGVDSRMHPSMGEYGEYGVYHRYGLQSGYEVYNEDGACNGYGAYIGYGYQGGYGQQGIYGPQAYMGNDGTTYYRY